MSRTPLILSTATAAIATAALIAAPGSAQGPTPTTLHLINTTQKTVGFRPNHMPHQGDRIGFGDTVSGDDHGIDRGICTFIANAQALCTIHVQLSKGTLTAQGLVLHRPPNKTTFAITGGTGAYNGARGTAVATQPNSKTTDIQITLQP